MDIEFSKQASKQESRNLFYREAGSFSFFIVYAGAQRSEAKCERMKSSFLVYTRHDETSDHIHTTMHAFTFRPTCAISVCES